VIRCHWRTRSNQGEWRTEERRAIGRKEFSYQRPLWPDSAQNRRDKSFAVFRMRRRATILPRYRLRRGSVAGRLLTKPISREADGVEVTSSAKASCARNSILDRARLKAMSGK
jgi:hypothetical protein